MDSYTSEPNDIGKYYIYEDGEQLLTNEEAAYQAFVEAYDGLMFGGVDVEYLMKAREQLRGVINDNQT